MSELTILYLMTEASSRAMAQKAVQLMLKYCFLYIREKKERSKIEIEIAFKRASGKYVFFSL